MKVFKMCFVAMVLFSMAMVAKAQTEEGSCFFGGSTSLNFSSINSKWKANSSRQDESSLIDLGISPSVEFFFLDNFSLGTALDLNYSSEENDNEQVSTTSLALSPFMKYYFGKEETKPYLQAEFGVGSIKYKEGEGYGSEETMLMTGWGLKGGIAMFLNEKVAIDFGLGYASLALKPKEYSSQNYKHMNNGLVVSVGLLVNLQPN